MDVWGPRPEYVPFHRHGRNYSLKDIIRYIVRTLETMDPGLKVVPFGNKLHVGKLKELAGEPVTEFKEEIPDRLIAWRIIKEAPTSRGTDPFTGIKELIPRYTDFQETPTGGLIRYDWSIDSLTGWQLFAKSTDELLEFQYWFRDQMFLLRKAVMFLGADKFFWLGHNMPDELSYQIAVNHVPEELYFFRTDRVYIEDISKLKSLDVTISADEAVKDAYRKSIDNYIASLKTRKKTVDRLTNKGGSR